MIAVIRKWLLQPRVSAAVVEAVLAFILFAFDPLGLSSQKAQSIDHMLSWITQYHYQSKATDKIAVVLIDEDSLNRWKMDWPITYAQTSGIINRLACSGAAAVFFDFTLSKKFNLAEGSDQLLATIRNPANSEPSCPNGKRPGNIPIFFGKIDGMDMPLSNALDLTHQTFSIEASSLDDNYWVGREEFPDRPVAVDQMSPAFGIVRQLCGHSLASAQDAKFGCPNNLHSEFPTSPLLLKWSGSINEKQRIVSDTDSCRNPPHWWQMLTIPIGLSSEAYFQPCPPILTLSARDLSRDYNYIAVHGDPSDVLAGRIVFVGTRLWGLNDTVSSPVHGRLPGVYKHAVALDNILTFGADYPTLPTRNTKFFLIALYYLMVELWSATLRSRIKILAKEMDTRLAVLFLISAAYAILFSLNRWPVSILLMAISYYFGADLLSALSRLAQGRTSTGKA